VSAGYLQPSRLPEALPAGESVLWQGRPQWQGLAVRAFHVRKIAIYFALLVIWRLASAWSDGESVILAARSAAWLLLPGVCACAVLGGLAWLCARTTRYMITTRRVILQFGIALPMTLNVPFRIIGSAALKCFRDGTGDIPLALTGSDRIAYFLLWPHARPWRAARAEPMLRAIVEAEKVAGVLSAALATAGANSVSPSCAAAAPNMGATTPAAVAA
jgi:Bacterial PH domain